MLAYWTFQQVTTQDSSVTATDLIPYQSILILSQESKRHFPDQHIQENIIWVWKIETKQLGILNCPQSEIYPIEGSRNSF